MTIFIKKEEKTTFWQNLQTFCLKTFETFCPKIPTSAEELNEVSKRGAFVVVCLRR